MAPWERVVVDRNMLLAKTQVKNILLWKSFPPSSSVKVPAVAELLCCRAEKYIKVSQPRSFLIYYFIFLKKRFL